jgi:hypothetical protein
MTPKRKLERAQVHLDEIDKAVNAYLFDPVAPYVAVGDHDTKTREFFVKVKVIRQQPDTWPEIVGDCVHNMRAALDHIAWSLTAKTTSSPGYPKQIAFPIFATHAEFVDRLTKVIGETPPETHAIFESCQPYHGPNGAARHPLMILKLLDDMDKHRRLHLVGGISSNFKVRFFLNDQPLDVLDQRFALGPFDDGDVIFRCRLKSPAPYVDAYFETAFQVAFDKEGPALGAPVDSMLKGLMDVVRNDILPLFEPFLT